MMDGWVLLAVQADVTLPRGKTTYTRGAVTRATRRTEDPIAMTALAFFRHVRPEFLPPSLRAMQASLPAHFGSLATLQRCDAIPADHRLITWTLGSIDAIMAASIERAGDKADDVETIQALHADIQQQPLRVFVFILCLRQDAVESVTNCFPNLPKGQKTPFYQVCMKLQPTLLKHAVRLSL